MYFIEDTVAMDRFILSLSLSLTLFRSPSPSLSPSLSTSLSPSLPPSLLRSLLASIPIPCLPPPTLSYSMNFCYIMNLLSTSLQKTRAL